MIQKILSRILVVVVLFGLTLDIEAQRKKKKKRNKGNTEQIVKPKPKPKPKKGAILAYEKVVTKEMKTDEGLFKVHSLDDTFLFEVPDSLLNREMLMVTRIHKFYDGSVKEKRCY